MNAVKQAMENTQYARERWLILATAVIRTTRSRSWRHHCPASASPARPPPPA